MRKRLQNPQLHPHVEFNNRANQVKLPRKILKYHILDQKYYSSNVMFKHLTTLTNSSYNLIYIKEMINLNFSSK